MDSKLTQGDVLDDIGVTIRVECRASTQSSLFVTANSNKTTHFPVDVRLTEGHGQRSGEHGADADGDRRNTDAGEQTGGEEK
jgi:hypothetical protein